MTKQSSPVEPAQPAKRGEAAWKAEKDRIAARNQEVRKAGKQERQAYEKRMAERRRSADLQDMVDVREKFGDHR
ncbi:MAG: hypothetical protein QOK25_1691 [Thermoleophilaceae bacterium]|jgi:hypothetical protein|nr:hypothetical protein [Thermoleophilaceae bacterium]